jgi:hypothetical protein
MKHRKLGKWSCCIALLTATGNLGCSGDSAPESSAEDEYLGVITLQQQAQLPSCDPGHRAFVYYVQETSSFYYCDGLKNHPLDLGGLDGQDGTSWLVVVGSADAARCPTGGALIQAGPDANADGELDSIASAVAVCNGAQGPAGPKGEDGVPGADGAPGAEGTPGVDGADGADGSSCHVLDNGDGTALVYCDDGTTATIGGDGGGDAELPEGPPGQCFIRFTGRWKPIARPLPGDVTINELMIHPAGLDPWAQWLELKLHDSFDLNGLELETSTGSTLLYPEGGDCVTLGPGMHLIVGRTANPTQNGGLPRVDRVFTFPLLDDDAIAVKADGILLHAVMWEPAQVPEENTLSLAVSGGLYPSNWTPYSPLNSGTPGVPNQCDVCW